MPKLQTKMGLLSVMFLGLFLIFTGYTDADLSAERNVIKNKFAAIVMNFFVQNTYSFAPLSEGFRVSGIMPGGFDVKSIRVNREGQKTLKYMLASKNINCDESLWSNLRIDIVDTSYSKKFSGNIAELSLSSQIADSKPDDWIAILRLDASDAVLKNKMCEFDIEIRSWKTSPTEPQKGIFATRKISNSVSTGNWQ